MKYRIAEWETYQHYKDRCPPWIKLHYALLSSKTWVMLDDASRVLAIACMLLASRTEGEIDGDPEYLQRVCYLNSLPDLAPLVGTGFLIPLADASNPLADDTECTQMLNQSARVSEQSRAEKRREENTYVQSHDDPCLQTEEEDDDPGVAIMKIPLIKGEFFDVTQEYIDDMQKCYPGIDVDAELLKLLAWNVNNEKNRKTKIGIKRHINSWLSKAQDRSSPGKRSWQQGSPPDPDLSDLVTPERG